MTTARQEARRAARKIGQDCNDYYHEYCGCSLSDAADVASDVWEEAYRELVTEIKKGTYRTKLIELAKEVLGE